ncbi:hypothetical protein B0H16DRAFT_1436329 [Mycena metata]|uniref:Uncharacterized protein n=1 Tax=Mycena metata TaxID=1033252 RepID=A0AAD7ME68_9AGAR|nr:hypothetical protein B0H16DRAFT_1436329 [Mycena metata]
MLTHIVKRGLANIQAATPEYIAQLKADAEVYEQAGPEMEVNPIEALPILITALFFLLVLASIRYTFGTVVATLAMVESPSAAVVVEQTLPAYKDEEPLIPTATDKGADVEAMVVNRKPITASLCATMRQLRSVGGSCARWRGAGMGIVHTIAHAVVAKVLFATLGGLFDYSLASLTLVSILTSLLLARVHLLWTHAIIAHPSPKSFLQRMVPRAECKPLLVPTLVLGAAQQATLLVPLAVAQLVRLQDITPETALRTEGCAVLLLALRVLAVPATAVILALFLLLPAAATRARIEAALLPADILSIVPIDRAPAALKFTAAWRAFDRAARLRVLKVYAKMVFSQTVVALVGILIIAAEVYVIGGERLGIFFTATRAQLELMAIEG